MSIFSRFFGKSDADDSADGQQLVANPKIERPLSLQVLSSALSPFDTVIAARRYREIAPFAQKGKSRIVGRDSL